MTFCSSAMTACLLEPELAGDDHELYLVRAFADFEDLRVTIVPRDERLVHETVAAEDLGGVAGVVHRCAAGDQLGYRGLVLVGKTSGCPPCGLVPGETGNMHARLHGGDHEGDRLERPDGLSEGVA